MEFFEVNLVLDVPIAGYRITVLDAHFVYERKGIPDVLLPRLAQLLKSPIFSSSNAVGPGEQRSDAATGMWKRLVSKGIAGLDPLTGRYKVPF